MCLCSDSRLAFLLDLLRSDLFYKLRLVTLARVSKHVDGFTLASGILRGDVIDLVADELRYILVLDFCLGDFKLKRLITYVTLRILSLSFSIATGVFDMDNGLFMFIIYFPKYSRRINSPRSA